jgi:hypothetical protein
LTLKVPSAAANHAARLLGRRSEGDENR